MKKFFTLVSIGMCIAAANAQPTLTSALNPVVNDMIKYQPADSIGVSEGSGGASQTWDFSSLTANGTLLTSTYVSPSSTPYASLYPTATLASVSPSLQGDTGYTYFSTSSSGMDLLGVSSATYDFVYNNPQTQLQWPMTYNTTFTDNFLAHMTVNGADVYRSGTYTILGDGYGTLTTPSGTYPNVLRMKADQLIYDTFMVSGFPAGSQKTVATTYNWMNATINQPLMTISYFAITSGSTTNYSKSVFYYSTGPVGLEEVKNTTGSLRLFPNPASSQCAVSYKAQRSGDVVVEVLDMAGKQAGLSLNTAVTAGSNTIQLDLSSLATGMYMVKLSGSEGTAVQKLQVTR